MLDIEKSGFDLYAKTKSELDVAYSKIKDEQCRVRDYVRNNEGLDPIDKLLAYSSIIKMKKALNEIKQRRPNARG